MILSAAFDLKAKYRLLFAPLVVLIFFPANLHEHWTVVAVIGSLVMAVLIVAIAALVQLRQAMKRI